ncbi:MAG: hypothetical protein IJI14_06235 [Anaerolineaceae bacterium]|nr:hypothetical protein [Anaerolineaceae bacterium]
MVKFGKYRIDIIYTTGYFNAGEVRATLSDFQTLRIIDVLNDTGSFSISSTTKTRCPFQPYDGILVYRNNIFIYAGILERIEEEYQFKQSCWTWTVSGSNFNSLLKKKLIFPGEISSSISFTERNLTFSNYPENSAIKEIIDYNVKDNINTYRYPYGYSIIGSTYINTARTNGLTASYRFDNVFDIVIGIANSMEYAIRPVYNPVSKKIVYYIDDPVDKSDTVIFSFENNNLNTFKIINQPHDETFILASYNSDDKSYADQEMWKTVAGCPIPAPNDSWRDSKEVLYKPKKEDFNNYYDYRILMNLALKEATSRRQTSSIYYEADINTITGPQYTYGYDINSAGTQFLNDYRLGDTIGIQVDGITYTGKVTRMEFDVTYGHESIKPIIGDILRGKFNRILNNLSNLNKSTTKTDNTEVR